MSLTLDSRPPLEPTTNEVHTPSPTHPAGTAKTGPVLRHKSSHHALKPNLDSSEEYPSPHSSIYEASVIQASPENIESYETYNTYDTYDFVAPARTTDEPPSWDNIIVNDEGEGVPISFLQPPSTKKTHTPHELYPITEQSSFATLRPSTSFTMKGRTSTSTLRPRSPGLNGKKRKSFSLSDVPPTPIEEPTQESPPPSPLPRPVQPHQAPPERMHTPPGLPTFNRPEAINYRLPPPKSSWRDGCFRASKEEVEWRKQTVGLPKGVIMRGENGVLVRGKFTPIRSGHLPPFPAQRHTVFQTPGQYEEPEPARAVPVPQSQREEAQPFIRAERARLEELNRSRTKERAEKMERRLKKIERFIFCCGLCELAAQNRHGFDGVAESPRERPLFVGGFV